MTKPQIPHPQHEPTPTHLLAHSAVGKHQIPRLAEEKEVWPTEDVPCCFEDWGTLATGECLR